MDTRELNRRRERELVEAWLLANEGQATEEQLQTLSAAIETDPEARQAILVLAHHQGWLTWQGGPSLSSAASARSAATSDCRACQTPVREAWSERFARWCGGMMRVPLFSARGLAAVVCLVGASFWFAATGEHAIAPSEISILDARIVGGTPCVWDSDGVPHLNRGHALHEGDSLQLREGIAEISLEHRMSEAKLIMEGPAAVLLARHAVPSLRYGRITVATDEDAVGRIPVETPFGRVMLEAGTEVGVSAFGGSAQVHVFTGVATIISPWLVSPEQEVVSKIVRAGEALYFDGVGDVALRVTSAAARRDQFTPQVSMQSDFLLVGPKYVEAIRKANPLAYWRFEVGDSSEVVLNEMGDHFHGQLRGKVRWVGPVGNQAIEFGVTPEPGSMVIAESWDDVLDGDFTLEAWIKPSHYHLGSIMGFIGEFDWDDGRNKHGVLLEVGGTSLPSAIHQPERIRFLHRSKLGVRGGVACFSDRSYQPRRWQHVAAVRVGDEIRLYLDGEVVATERDPSRMTLGLQLVLGQLYTETVERFFIGHVDEVAIYDRALAPEEVRRHHRLLRPAEDKSPGGKERSMKLTGAEQWTAPSPLAEIIQGSNSRS